MAYPSVVEIQAYIDTPGDATVIGQMRAYAIEAVEQYTNRTFITNTATKTFPARMPFVTQFTRVLTPFDDLSTITTVTNGNGDLVSDYYVQTNRSGTIYQLILKPESGVIWQNGSDGTHISIAGSWSYSASCPDDIFLVIMQICQMSLASKEEGAGVTVTKSGVIIDKSKWTEEMVRVLDGKARR